MIQHGKLKAGIPIYGNNERKSGSIGHPVEIMSDGKDARIVFKSFLYQNLECPIGFFRNGVAGSAVTDDFHPDQVLENHLALSKIVPEFFLGLTVDQLVIIPVRGNLMTVQRDFFD